MPALAAGSPEKAPTGTQARGGSPSQGTSVPAGCCGGWLGVPKASTAPGPTPLLS